MKLTIDTTAKTIEVDQAVNLDELVKEVKRIFPQDWKEYKLLPTLVNSYWPVWWNDQQLFVKTCYVGEVYNDVGVGPHNNLDLINRLYCQ